MSGTATVCRESMSTAQR